MNLSKLLKPHLKEIAEEWFREVINTYPDESVKFLMKDKKKFANPVGFNISQEISAITEELITFEDNDLLIESIDNLMRIRAVQDMKPSQATAIFLPLKEIIEKYLVVKKGNNIKEYIEMCRRIDYLTSLGFDSYVKMVKKIYDIKSNEVEKRFGKAVERINRKYGFDDSIN
jgi:thiol-disulfide isomerase/thioredoxin